MKVVYNNIIPFRRFKAINIFGVLFVRKGSVLSAIELNHERIHTAQMKELLYVGFYLWYFVEWLIELLHYRGRAYHTNTFEREAYSNDENLGYLGKRKRFAWWEYR